MNAGKSIDRKAGGMKARKAALLLVTLALLFAAPAYGADYDTTLIITNPGAGVPFYPFVKDGYRDTIWAYLRETTVNLYDDQPYCDVPKVPSLESPVAVLDSADQVVRHLDGMFDWWVPSRQHSGENGEFGVLLKWDGRDDAGNLVPKNTWYRFQATATPQCWMFDEWGNAVAAGIGDTETVTSAAFKAATKTVTKTASKSRSGGNPSSKGSTRGCYVAAYEVLNVTDLYCDGGRSANASYLFKVPPTAFDITYNIKGSGSYSGPYSYKPIAKRPRNDKVVVGIRIGGYITYHIHAAKIWYSYKQQL
jgi:hypothetical protein